MGLHPPISGLVARGSKRHSQHDVRGLVGLHPSMATDTVHGIHARYIISRAMPKLHLLLNYAMLEPRGYVSSTHHNTIPLLCLLRIARIRRLAFSLFMSPGWLHLAPIQFSLALLVQRPDWRLLQIGLTPFLPAPSSHRQSGNWEGAPPVCLALSLLPSNLFPSPRATQNVPAAKSRLLSSFLSYHFHPKQHPQLLPR